jgi:DNA-3-methyladenine glycosylase I
MSDAGIVRHRRKIESAINNARCCIELIDQCGSLAGYVWSHAPADAFETGRLDWPTLVGRGTSSEAAAMSRDLKRRGWSFVGPTTVFSMMEAVGIVNDHMTACDFRDEVESERRRFQPRAPRP